MNWSQFLSKQADPKLSEDLREKLADHLSRVAAQLRLMSLLPVGSPEQRQDRFLAFQQLAFEAHHTARTLLGLPFPSLQSSGNAPGSGIWFQDPTRHSPPRQIEVPVHAERMARGITDADVEHLAQTPANEAEAALLTKFNADFLAGMPAQEDHLALGGN